MNLYSGTSDMGNYYPRVAHGELRNRFKNLVKVL